MQDYGTSSETTQKYWYMKNAQGDIMGLVKIHANGSTSIEAVYYYSSFGEQISTVDASGNAITSTSHIAHINPFRYRGYYYDAESNLYYLGSRYYDPEICRFISTDDPSVLTATLDGVTDKNLFAYCDNNPIVRADNGGKFWNFVIGAAVGAVVGGVVSGVTSWYQTGKVDWGSVAINAAVGLVSGLIGASGLNCFAQAGLSAVVSGAGNFTEQCYSKGIENVNYADVGISAALGGAFSFAGSGVGGLSGKGIKDAGLKLLSKGQDKLLTSMVRKSVGQSSSALRRQGYKFVAQAVKKFNTAQGLSSVIGSGLGGVGTGIYNEFKVRIFG